MSKDLPTDPRFPLLEDDFLMQSQESGSDVIPDNWNRGAQDHPWHTTIVRITSGAR
jgi:hypothetical protein